MRRCQIALRGVLGDAGLVSRCTRAHAPSCASKETRRKRNPAIACPQEQPKHFDLKRTRRSSQCSGPSRTKGATVVGRSNSGGFIKKEAGNGNTEDAWGSSADCHTRDSTLSLSSERDPAIARSDVDRSPPPLRVAVPLSSVVSAAEYEALLTFKRDALQAKLNLLKAERRVLILKKERATDILRMGAVLERLKKQHR